MTYVYSKTLWKDKADGIDGTIIDAAKLNNIEDGIYNSYEHSDKLNEKLSAELFEMTKEVNDAKGDKETLKLKLIDMENRAAENVAKQYLEASTSDGSLKVENCYNGLTKDLNVKGRTLQNLGKKATISGNNNTQWWTVEPTIPFKSNTEYTFVYWFTGDFTFSSIQTSNANGEMCFPMNVVVGKANEKFIIFKQTSISIGVEKKYGLKFYDLNGTINIECLLLENDRTANPPTSYFEGIKSLGEEENKISILSTGNNLVDNSKNKMADIDSTTGVERPTNNCVVTDYINISYLKDFTVNATTKKSPITFRWYDKDKIYISNATTINSRPQNSHYVRLRILQQQDLDIKFNLVQGTVLSTAYEPYKEDKKDILLPVQNGAKGFDNGAADEQYTNGDYLQRVEKVVLNGTEDWKLVTSDKLIVFSVKDSKYKLCTEKSSSISNYNLTLQNGWNDTWGNISDMGFSLYNQKGYLQILIQKNKVPNITTVDEFKNMLISKNMEIFYELAEPILHKATEPTDLNIATFKDITHMSCLNKIAPSSMSAKFPVDVAATFSRLNRENKEQELKNIELKKENLELQNKASDLTVENEMQQLDIDINMLATIDLFEMMVGATKSSDLDQFVFKGGDGKMVEVYVSMIIKGKKKLEDVPAIIRPQVEQMLKDLGIIS